MKNIHIEHPEDQILTGDLSVIDLLYDFDSVSVKIDGAPAIVWGTNPATGKFFVGTKSVFNKVKIKINHSHEEIDQNHEGKVASILHSCFDYLPRTNTVYQGDFIGFGGSDTYRPNTITYKFDEVISQDVIIAPHTCYYAASDLRDAVSMPDRAIWNDTEHVKFVKPSVDRMQSAATAPIINTDKIQFLTDKQAKECKQIINAFIREGKELHDALLTEILGCQYLSNLYLLVMEMKEDLMDSLIVSDAPKAYIEDQEINQEGYVISGDKGMTKLVNRHKFSYANFALPKAW